MLAFKAVIKGVYKKHYQEAGWIKSHKEMYNKSYTMTWFGVWL